MLPFEPIDFILIYNVVRADLKYMGYWPSVSQDGGILAKVFFACLWTEMQLRSINTEKMNIVNPLPLIEQA